MLPLDFVLELAPRGCLGPSPQASHQSGRGPYPGSPQNVSKYKLCLLLAGQKFKIKYMLMCLNCLDFLDQDFFHQLHFVPLHAFQWWTVFFCFHFNKRQICILFIMYGNSFHIIMSFKFVINFQNKNNGFKIKSIKI